MRKVRVYIEKQIASHNTKIWLLEEYGDGVVNITTSKGELVRQEIPAGEVTEDGDRTPLLVLPMVIADEFLKSIQEHLKSIGVKTKDENRIEGELNAKQEHLNDMRMIVNKVLKIDK